MRAVSALRWALIAVYAVMWIGGIVTTCWTRSTSSPWMACLFLLSAGTLAALETADASVLVFAVGGFLAEVIGVHFGLPFGGYSYTNQLGPMLAGVPVAIAAAWVVLLIFARDLARRLSTERWTEVFLGALIMTVLDLLIDPVATQKLNYWHWRESGIYFGIPLLNFGGWYVVSAFLLAIPTNRARVSGQNVALGSSIILFFLVIAIFS